MNRQLLPSDVQSSKRLLKLLQLTFEQVVEELESVEEWYSEDLPEDEKQAVADWIDILGDMEMFWVGVRRFAEILPAVEAVAQKNLEKLL
jgi:hypothetical protein